jgi:hypothetical protein
MATGIESVLNILLKRFAGSGAGNFAARAVEQLGADFFLKSANLRRDSRLSPETLLRRPRERGVPGHFEEGFELVEVHESAQRSAISPRAAGDTRHAVVNTTCPG